MEFWGVAGSSRNPLSICLPVPLSPIPLCILSFLPGSLIAQCHTANQCDAWKQLVWDVPNVGLLGHPHLPCSIHAHIPHPHMAAWDLTLCCLVAEPKNSDPGLRVSAGCTWSFLPSLSLLWV